MRSRLQTLDILANNMANASSRGYKADREIYSLYSSEDSFDPSEAAAQKQPHFQRRGRQIDTSWRQRLTSVGQEYDQRGDSATLIGIAAGLVVSRVEQHRVGSGGSAPPGSGNQHLDTEVTGIAQA